MNPQKLLDRGFIEFGPNWYVKLFRKGDTQHGIAVLMTKHGPTVLRAAESVSEQAPAAIAGVVDELAEVGLDIAESEDFLTSDDDIYDEALREWEAEDDVDYDELAEDELAYNLEEDSDALEWDEAPLEVEGGVGEELLELDGEVGARGRRRRKARRAGRRTARRGRRKERRAARRERRPARGDRRARRRGRVQRRRDASKFRQRVNKAAGRLARGKVMKKLRNAKVKILQSPLADAATSMAAKALEAYGVPPQVTKMALNTAREAGIDRGKKGGWAGMAMRATAKGAKRGTLLREGAERQKKALKGGFQKTFPGGFSDVLQSFAASASTRSDSGIGPGQMDLTGKTSVSPWQQPSTKKRRRAMNATRRERAVLRATQRGGV